MKTNSFFPLCVFVCLSQTIFAQAPQAIPYQAVARDNAGNIITNQSISIRFGIYPSPTAGILIYQETHSVTTNALGLFTANVGQGVVISGTFSSIKWGSGDKFLQVEMDAAGGNIYSFMGRSQMLSVPYALQAGESTAILDSLVLRDSTGNIRMVMNPNTGIFKMMDNDSVWYSIQVNSPPSFTESLGGGYTHERGSGSTGGSYDIVRNPAGGIVKSEIIHIEPNNDVVTVKRENAPDGSPLNISTETFTHENSLTVRLTSNEEYVGGVMVTKTQSNGYTTTVEHFDPTTGLLDHKEVKEPDYGLNGLLRVKVYDGNGNQTSERQEDSKGQITGYFTFPYSKSTVVKPGELTTESPDGTNKTSSSGSEQKNGTITYTNGIDGTDPYGLSAGFSCTEDATSNKSGITVEPSKLFLWTPELRSESAVACFQAISTAGSCSFSVTPTLLCVNGPLTATGPSSLSGLTTLSGLSVPGATTLGGCTVNSGLTVSGGATLSGPSVGITSGPNSFSVTPTFSSWAGTLSLSGPISSNNLSIGSGGLTVSGPSSLSGLSTLSGLSVIGATNLDGCTVNSGLTVSGGATLSGPSVGITSGPNSFNVTPTFSSWAGTLSLSGPISSNNLTIGSGGLTVTGSSSLSGVTVTSGATISQASDNITLNGSGINLTGGTNPIAINSPYGVTMTGPTGSGSCTLSLGGSGLTMAGLSNWAGTVTVSNSSDINITGGGLTASGTVSAGSLSGNGGLITLINGSNITTGTIGDGRLSANIPKLNTPNIFSGPLVVGPPQAGQDAVIGVAFGQTPGAPSNLAGKFYGNVNITGNLTKGGGTFKIDHPLDPKNKYLYHSFVESPDMMNIYTGTIALDSTGKAIVELPDWFEALNKDFHYQLTCIGGFAQVFINKEITNNQFEIAGGKKGMKVSWQVTGVRHDAYADKHRVIVEEDKPIEERGTYLHPEAFTGNE